MARDEADSDDGRNIDSGSETGDIGSNNRLLGRRSYLKAAGVASLVGAGITGAGTGAATSDYELIEVPAGELWEYRLDDGETFENKLIDISADGAEARINAVGDNWTVRNIGWRGVWDTTNREAFIYCAVESADATGRIENCYMGDGAISTDYPNSPNGIYVNRNHAGELTISNVNIQHVADNAVYASEAGRSGNGPVIIEDSFAADLEPAAWRVGSDGSRVENCVAVNAHRGVWVRHRSAEVVDCDLSECRISDLYVGEAGLSVESPTCTLRNTRYGSSHVASAATLDGSSAGSAQRTTPEEVEGVPVTAEEAASGSSDGSTGGSSDGSDDESESAGSLLAFVTDPEARYASYEFTADGPVEFADAPYESPSGGNIEGGTYTSEDFVESADGTWRAGGVTGGGHGDAYRVDGSLTSISVDNPDVMWVELDGEEIDPDSVGDSDLENTLLVDGVGTAGGTRYEFTVGGAVEKSTAGSASINADDRIESGTVTGSVGGWRDAFRFSGDLEELTVDGTARVYVNGEQVDPADYGDERPHVLTLVGNGSAANYEISVDGTIDAAVGDDAAASATIAENTVDGSIERGVQRFQFSGTVSDITFTNGSANVYVDDEEVDPDEIGESELLPHAITIDGSDADGESSYAFETDGDVVASSYRDATVDDGDVIDGATVSGSVADSLDAYWFDGDIVDFRLTGDASVDVEYDVRD
ncbi:hypothetical protein HTG_02485 [Natrinema mahii]|nr:hypothetical protein HTG_02485 [Natrinema mahii]